MPSAEDLIGDGSAGGGTPTGGSDADSANPDRPKSNAYCSFCRKSYRDVGPLVEGPREVYICGQCIELCQSILDEERRRQGENLASN